MFPSVLGSSRLRGSGFFFFFIEVQTMTVQIYVGNLPFSATEGDLRSAFEKFGAVSSAKIVTDRDTGRAKGFGFVEMADQAAADKAISSLDGADMGGRNIKVNIARPKK